MPMRTLLDGSEAEVLALEPSKPRQVIAASRDGKYAASRFVRTDDPQPKAIRLEPTGSLSGRLLDASTGRPLAGYAAWLAYPHKEDYEGMLVVWLGERVKTAADGRFRIGGVIPGLGAAIELQEPVQPGAAAQAFQPNSLQDLVVRAGEVRSLGDIRIEPSAAAR